VITVAPVAVKADSAKNGQRQPGHAHQDKAIPRLQLAAKAARRQAHQQAGGKGDGCADEEGPLSLIVVGHSKHHRHHHQQRKHHNHAPDQRNNCQSTHA